MHSYLTSGFDPNHRAILLNPSLAHSVLLSPSLKHYVLLSPSLEHYVLLSPLSLENTGYIVQPL